MSGNPTFVLLSFPMSLPMYEFLSVLTSLIPKKRVWYHIFGVQNKGFYLSYKNILAYSTLCPDDVGNFASCNYS